MQMGTKIDEAGVLLREEHLFYLRRETGGRFRVDLRRTGEGLLGHHVRLRGTYVGDDLVDADQIELA
jgi:hypothetical protein